MEFLLPSTIPRVSLVYKWVPSYSNNPALTLDYYKDNVCTIIYNNTCTFDADLYVWTFCLSSFDIRIYGPLPGGIQSHVRS